MQEKAIEIRKVFVIGAGIMGRDIAQVAVEAGFEVLLGDLSNEIVEKAMRNIEERLQKRVDRGEIDLKVKDAIMCRIKISCDLAESSKADFVIDAVIEDAKIKKSVFATLDRFCPPEIILATNTSALSISEIASVTKNPERVIGMHFFNPVTKMNLVEVVRGKRTSEQAVLITKKLAEKLGKTTVDVNESPGFIVNRLLIPMLNEAIFTFSERVASKESIDSAMKLGAGHPIGPLALADFIGIDVCLSVMETLEKEFKDPKYHPCPLLRKMVGEGKLGRKTGEGFYKY